MFDVTRRETLQALERRWFPDLEHHVHAPDVIKLVIGNKTDVSWAHAARAGGQRSCGVASVNV